MNYQKVEALRRSTQTELSDYEATFDFILDWVESVKKVVRADRIMRVTVEVMLNDEEKADKKFDEIQDEEYR